MKRFNYLIYAVYLLFMFYTAVLNWQLFALPVDINLGFSISKLPLVLSVFIFGLVFLLIQMLGYMVIMARKNKNYIRIETELNTLKASNLDSANLDLQDLSEKVSLIIDKLDKPKTIAQVNTKGPKEEQTN